MYTNSNKNIWYRCSAGCFHIAFGQVMLNLSSEQLLAFADAIGEMRQEALATLETTSSEVSHETVTNPLLM